MENPSKRWQRPSMPTQGCKLGGLHECTSHREPPIFCKTPQLKTPCMRHNECTPLQTYGNGGSINNAPHKKILCTNAHSSPVSELLQGMTVLQLFLPKSTLFFQIPK